MKSSGRALRGHLTVTVGRVRWPPHRMGMKSPDNRRKADDFYRARKRW